MKRYSAEFKVGLFAIAIIAILTWATIRVSDKTSVSAGGYDLEVIFDNATGLKLKAPVELAGVQVGVVSDVKLMDSRQALVVMAISDRVQLPDDSTAVLRTRGFLGETYVEILPGTFGLPLLQEGEMIPNAFRTGDVNSLVSQFSEIADDIKHVTGSLRTMVGDDSQSPINRIVENLDTFTQSIRDLTVRNSENVDRISENLAAMTTELRSVVQRSQDDIEESMDRIASISRKIDEGKGTVGRLVNDEETIDKLNEAVDNLNQALGGYRRLEAEIGYHTEYMTKSKDFKNYVDLALRPSPDKAFLIGVVSDPNPNPRHVTRTTDVTVGDNTTRVTTDTATIDRNAFRFSAQIAKSFYDFQVRGGLIESTGGFGLDYAKGPVAVHFDAFDFQTRYGERPHLKAMGELKLTRNFYLVGGADDFIANEDRADWFLGAGFRFVDDDLKSVAGIGVRMAK